MKAVKSICEQCEFFYPVPRKRFIMKDGKKTVEPMTQIYCQKSLDSYLNSICYPWKTIPTPTLNISMLAVKSFGFGG